MLTPHFLSMRRPRAGNTLLHRKASGNYYHKGIFLWNPHSSVWAQARNSKVQGDLWYSLKTGWEQWAPYYSISGHFELVFQKIPYWYLFPKGLQCSDNVKEFLAQEKSMKYLLLFLCCNWERCWFRSADTRACIHRNDRRNIHHSLQLPCWQDKAEFPLNSEEVLKSSVDSQVTDASTHRCTLL